MPTSTSATSKMTNIGQNNHDSNYRYKMPLVVTKIEGRGNGIKTIITNIVDIAKALHVHPSYPTKFFGIELGSQSKFDSVGEKSIINGHHQISSLSIILDSFIKMIVLCPSCKLPELCMSVKSTSIKISCQACGYTSKIKDGVHKIIGYIIKHPHSTKTFKQEKNDKGDKVTKKTKDKIVVIGDSDLNSDQEQIWHTDVSESAQLERQMDEFKIKKGKDNIQSIINIAKSNNKEDDPVTLLSIFITFKKRTPIEVDGELNRIALARDLNETNKIQVFLDYIFQDAAQLRQNLQIFSVIMKKNKNTLLQKIEDYVGIKHPQHLCLVNTLFEILYEEGILKEEDFMYWNNNNNNNNSGVVSVPSNPFRLAASPFIDWLITAEYESDQE